MLELYQTHEKSIANLVQNNIRQLSIGTDKSSEKINTNPNNQEDLSSKTEDLEKCFTVNQDQDKKV